MSTLTGCRVLIAEDETLVGLDIRAILVREGCEVFGPFANVREATLGLNMWRPNAAVLDIFLVGGKVFPLAAALARRGVPFMFVTGYSRTWIPTEYLNRRIVAKPFAREVIVEALEGLVK